MRIRLLLLISGLLFGTMASAEGEPKLPASVRLVADNWCPQHCADHPKLHGYIVDIVSTALQLEHVAVSVEFRPWLRALSETEEGLYDGLLTPTDTYRQFLHNQEAVGYQEYCLYTKRDAGWTYHDYTDLFGRKVTFLKESGLGTLEQQVDANHDKITAEEVAGGERYTQNIFAFLDHGRTDAVIITSDVYQFNLKEKLIPDHFKAVGCLGPEKLTVGFTKARMARSRKIADALDSGIRKLRASGQLQTIADQYGLSLWE